MCHAHLNEPLLTRRTIQYDCITISRNNYDEEWLFCSTIPKGNYNSVCYGTFQLALRNIAYCVPYVVHF